MNAEDKFDTRTLVLWCLLTAHTTLLISSNVAGAKVIALPFGLAASAAVLSYIVTFLIISMIAEIWGKRAAELVILLGLASLAASVAFVELAIYLPPYAGWPHQSAFETALGSSWRVLLGGWTSYLIGQYVDVRIYLWLKRIGFAKKFVGLRVWISMVIAQLADTIVFVTVLFWGVAPILETIAGQYLIKVAITTVAAPLAPAAIRLAFGREGRTRS